MTTYTVQGPSGKSYTIDGPEGATADQLGQVVLSNSHEERVAAEYARGKIEYNPTNDMSTGQRFTAAVGRAGASIGRAVGLGSLMPGGADTEDAQRADAPLLATKAGKWGNALGTATFLAPVAMIPGVNSYAAAAGVAGLTGAATTEGGLMDRATGALGGATGGALGQGAGNLIGKSVAAMRNSSAAQLASKQAANAVKDANVASAQDKGYVVTPSMTSGPGFISSALEGLGGKIKTQQAASVRNQTVTNNLIGKDLGLPTGEPITKEALDKLRTTAGGAYADVAGYGKFNVQGANLPVGANVKSGFDRMTMTPKSEVDAADLVKAWKQSNADATAYYRMYGRDANPETLAKAKTAAANAKAVDDFLASAVGGREAKSTSELIADLASGRISHEEFLADSLRSALRQNGKPSALEALQAARVQFAKTYNVESALNPATGDVVASKLAAQQAKGKKLSGGLKDVADFASAFPAAAQSGKDVPRYSVLDMLAAGHAGGPAGVAIPLLRPAARSAALSGPVQRGLIPDYEVNPLLQLASDPRLSRGLLPVTSGNLIGPANARQ